MSLFRPRGIFSEGQRAVGPATRLVRPGLTGFKTFLMRGNVVDLAVALVIGTAFTAVVKSFVANLLTPLIAAIGGEPNFSSLSFTLHHSRFAYGAFLNDVISFVIVAAAIYFVVVLPIAKASEFRRRGEEPTPEEPAISDETRLLTEIRDLLAAGREIG
jgi:large conductance mechanosensitive channel